MRVTYIINFIVQGVCILNVTDSGAPWGTSYNILKIYILLTTQVNTLGQFEPYIDSGRIFVFLQIII